MPFLDEIEGWDPARVTVRTDDVDGMPSSMDLLGSTAPGGSVCIINGPPPMIDLVRARSTPPAASASTSRRRR